MYSPTMSLTDPPANSSVTAAAAWIQSAALGTVATTVAVIAIATIGLLMMWGRLELRRGITVVLGCFILIGASDLAAALTGLTRAEVQRSEPIAPDRGPLPSPLQAPPPVAYDPYAGASVPTAR